MTLNLLTWLLALSPVLMVLVLMLGFKWGGSRAGAAAWFVTIIIAVVFFGSGLELIAYSLIKAIFLSVDVLLIIWTALLLFHIADEAGAVAAVGSALPRLTPNRMLQGLLLGWIFASFLQGMGGFGVPVAVAAPLLVSIGFSPVDAVIMACLGHGWAVNFGSLATSFQTLMAVTGLPGELLAPESGILLGAAAFPCGALVAFFANGWKGLLRGLPVIAILSLVMGGVQYWLVTHHLWTLGATGGALAGLIVGILIARFSRQKHRAGSDQNDKTVVAEKPASLLISLSAYLVLVIIAFAVNLIEPLNAFLSQVKFSLPIPELRTALGWITPAENTRAISLLDHPGAILLYASLIAFLIYRGTGRIKNGSFLRIINKVAAGAVNSSLGIIAMVGIAAIMSASGMTNILAEGLSASFGQKVYPLVAPFIGALGAFITGSNNNSNVLFALLQMRTADLLGLSSTLILAAQTAGGSLGSVLAPAKVIVGCSTVGLGDNESLVMGKILKYGIIPILVVALLALFMVLL